VLVDLYYTDILRWKSTKH